MDPFLTALSSRALTSALAAGLNPYTNVFEEMGRAFWDSAGRIITADGRNFRTPYEQSLYLSKVNDFSNVIRSDGLEKALEQHAAAILSRDAVETVWEEGGIAGILTRQTRFITLNNVPLKEVKISDSNLLYLHAENNALVGRQIGDRLEWGNFVLGDDGVFFLANGSVTVDMEFAVVRLRVQNGQFTGASVELREGEGPQLMVDPIGDQLFSPDGLLINGKIENTLTGVKVVIRDGFVEEFRMSSLDGTMAIDLLESVSFRNMTSDELFGIVSCGISCGIQNPNPEGFLPDSLAKLAGDIANSPSVGIDSVMVSPLFEEGNLSKDVLSWLWDAMGTNILTNEMVQKIDTEILVRGGMPENGMTMVVYSGSFNPLLRAIDQRGYNITTIVAIAGQTTMDRAIPDEVQKIVYVVGDKDRFFVKQEKPDFRHSDGTAVETIYVKMTNSAINPDTDQPFGVGHTQFFAGSGETNPYLVATHNFLLELIRNSSVTNDPGSFLELLVASLESDSSYAQPNDAYVLDAADLF